MAYVGDGKRQCPRCKYIKPNDLENFYEQRTGPLKYRGPSGWCKPCHSKRHKARYRLEPEYKRASLKQSSAFYTNNLEHCRELISKRREVRHADPELREHDLEMSRKAQRKLYHERQAVTGEGTISRMTPEQRKLAEAM
jgi:hypothetical protein